MTNGLRYRGRNGGNPAADSGRPPADARGRDDRHGSDVSAQPQAASAGVCRRTDPDEIRLSRLRKEAVRRRSSRLRKEHTHHYVVAKWAVLRSIGLVYLVAFLAAYRQNNGLIGDNGLLPASEFKRKLAHQYESSWQAFLRHPTIFWWLPVNDRSLQAVYKTGILLSAFVVTGQDSVLVMIALWILYFSIVTVAGLSTFYAYGWESQLLETGFLAIFLCDLLPTLFTTSNLKSQPSEVVMWLFRWLCFRISLGAGLIKIRGDSCWTDRSCLYHHFETQPIPSPLSFLFHFLPKPILARAVDLDLFVQVYTSWMVLLPTARLVPGTIGRLLTRVVRIGGFIQIAFMVNIILSGNFAFLNHLTIVPALACLDDESWPRILRVHVWQRSDFQPLLLLSFRRAVNLCLFLLIASLSWPVVDNLFQLSGTSQLMNASFDSFRLVNTYGAFGNVGKQRYEPIVSVSHDGIEWKELDFPCKPGNVTRRPCFCAPYHYRADWNIWFIGFKPHGRMLNGRERWLIRMLRLILDDDRTVDERPWLDLLDTTSADFLKQAYTSQNGAPKYAKVDMYHYQMAAPLWDLLPRYYKQQQGTVAWWNRTFDSVLVPPVRLSKDTDEKYRLQRANLVPDLI